MENRPNILIVDDEKQICEFLSDYLQAHGYDVQTANDGAAMRDVMASHDIDLVILDLVMPGEDGLTLTHYLRETSNVAVIILTGKDEEVNRIIGLEMGADDYVAKPFSSRELLARVKTVLRRSKNVGGAAPAKGYDAITFAG
jgi:two-component system OmpR family response regulator